VYPNSSPSTGQFQPEVITEILISIRYLRHRKTWPDARDRAEMAIFDWNRERRERPKFDVEADQLAKDVYDLLGVPLAMGRREAQRLTTRTMEDAVCDELAACVREAKFVGLPARTSTYRGMEAAVRGA